MIPIELTVEEQDDWHYRICWCDGENLSHQYPLYVARSYPLPRRLLAQGYNLKRQLIVRLRGADFELMHAAWAITHPTKPCSLRSVPNWHSIISPPPCVQNNTEQRQ